jgi:hypothetical protein
MAWLEREYPGLIRVKTEPHLEAIKVGILNGDILAPVGIHVERGERSFFVEPTGKASE